MTTENIIRIRDTQSAIHIAAVNGKIPRTNEGDIDWERLELIPKKQKDVSSGDRE